MFENFHPKASDIATRTSLSSLNKGRMIPQMVLHTMIVIYILSNAYIFQAIPEEDQERDEKTKEK